jgi:RNA polymerase sigma factor (sigma-70 family)
MSRFSAQQLPAARLREALRSDGLVDRTDADLLDRFARYAEHAAFEVLLRRHGPMVFGVCRRVLANFADAEDAFQATFLVLVRKARTIRGERIGPWLYGVAFRVAMKARSRACRVAQRRAEVTEMISDSAVPTESPDWLPILDAELNALPAKYREPLVLCELQGTTRAIAAKALGIPEGTLSSRLARARELLRRRLLKHGTLLPMGGLAALFSANGLGRAAVPAALIAKTSEMVAVVATGTLTAGVVPAGPSRLTDEVIRGMFLMKLRVAAGALLMVGLVAFGLSAWSAETPGQQEKPRSAAAAPAVKVPQADAKPESTRAANGLVSIKFTSPADMKVAWQLREESAAPRLGDSPDSSSGEPRPIPRRLGIGSPSTRNRLVQEFLRGFKAYTDEVTVPKQCEFLQGQVYRLRLSQVSPKHKDKSFYPTLEVSPANPKTATFVAHACVPIAFTDEDFDQAVNDNLVVKVIYLAERDNDIMPGIDEVVSTRLEPGVDPVAEARRRGSILAVVRLGNIDLEDKSPPAKVGNTADAPNRFRGAGQELVVDGGTIVPDRETVQGLWVLDTIELGKGAKPEDQKDAQEMKGKLQFLVSGDVWWGMLEGGPSGNLGPHLAKLDSTKNPKLLDLEEVELLTMHIGKCIYELEGEKLRICMPNDPSKGRPAEFNLDDAHVVVVTFRRGKMPPASGDKPLIGSWQGSSIHNRDAFNEKNFDLNEKNFSITSPRVEILDGFLFAFVPADPVTAGKWIGGRYTVDTTKNPKWIDLELVEPFGESKVTKLYGCYEVADGRLKLALGTNGKRVFRPLEFTKAKDVLFLDLKTTKEPLRPIEIEKMLRVPAPQPKPELAPQPKPRAADPDEEVEGLMKEGKFATAESRLRELLPDATGLQLAQRHLVLGVCLVQQAMKADPDQANKLWTEAEELYRKARTTAVKAPADSKQAAWIRTQAGIRTLQLFHLMGKPNTVLAFAPTLVEQHQGKVEELIARSFMFHAFKQKGEHDRAREVYAQMKALFEKLKDKPGSFSAEKDEKGEYSRKYWERVWFAEK